MSTDLLQFENRLRQNKGREARTQSVATRFTQAEEQALLKTAEACGQNLREWARDVLLREAKQSNDSVSTEALMTEIVGLQLFLTHALQPVACGEQMSPHQYEELMRQVKVNKYHAAREVIAQHVADSKEKSHFSSRRLTMPASNAFRRAVVSNRKQHPFPWHTRRVLCHLR